MGDVDADRESSRLWPETKSQFPEAFSHLSSSIESKSPEPWFRVGERDLGPVAGVNVTSRDPVEQGATSQGSAKKGWGFEPHSLEEGLKPKEAM